MSAEDGLGGILGRLYAEGQERTAAAEAFYAMLSQRGELKSHRVLSYRCPRRCLLADVLNTQQGLIVHQPRYKLSPALNSKTSNESGRRKNTEDGDRRWKARTYPIGLAANLTLACDHVPAHHVLELEQVHSDLAAKRREVIVTP